jgi:integrase
MGNEFNVLLQSNGKYWTAIWNEGGKRKGKTLGPKSALSQRRAEARCRELAVDLRLRAKRKAGAAPRLSEWIARYLSLNDQLSAGTKALVEHTGRYLLEFFDDDPTIDTITRVEAAEWRAALAAGNLAGANKFPKAAKDTAPATKYARYRKRLEARPARQISETTVAKHVRCAKRIFEIAADEKGLGLIDRNPFRVLAGTAPDAEKNWDEVTAGDMTAIYEACPSNGWRCLFALCRWAGMRRGEALALRWGDINWDKNQISVHAELDRRTTKKAKRTIPIEPRACPTGLMAWLLQKRGEAADRELCPCGQVSQNNIHRNAIAIVQRALGRAYAKPFHTLRKNRENELVKSYPQHVVIEWQGHSVEVARDHYLRVGEEWFAAPESAQNRAQTGGIPGGGES